ncbi:hypothetical protein DERP_010655 [Dermatophagoides pteronyssinus]|uniref:Uncharacterized protein n=1 Tax=Dermatophagoides pteronyssinus TaxID=6956 RepID=A0ABQ8JA48_DERPT|nr:hypothetical protein DERP_010655 [Dermatophagoides pteronyssinus]
MQANFAVAQYRMIILWGDVEFNSFFPDPEFSIFRLFESLFDMENYYYHKGEKTEEEEEEEEENLQ